MTSEDFEMSNQSMIKVSASELLESFSSSSFPHMDKGQREKLHRAVYGTANPIDNAQAISTEDLARLISRGGG